MEATVPTSVAHTAGMDLAATARTVNDIGYGYIGSWGEDNDTESASCC